jgi:dTDP-glucose 4,6-dehydratase
MAILVTGGLGFIGRHVVARLRAAGHEVRATDLAIRSDDGYVRADITQFDEIARLFRGARIEQVVHLAAEVGRPNGEEFPARCVDVNIRGTVLLAEACRQNGARLLFASSSEIYGDCGDRLLVESLVDERVVRPMSSYGWTKLQAEQHLRHLSEHSGLAAKSLRIFTAYGPGEWPSPYRSAMTLFIDRLRRGQPIDVHRGTARPWIYVDDVVEAVRLAVERWDGTSYEAINIGRPGPVATEHLASELCVALGRPASLINLVDRGNLVVRTKNGSFERAADRIGFVAGIDIDDGIARTLAWHEANVDVSSPEDRRVH